MSFDAFVVFSRRFTALKQYSDELNTVISQLLRVRAVSFHTCTHLYLTVFLDLAIVFFYDYVVVWPTHIYIFYCNIVYQSLRKIFWCLSCCDFLHHLFQVILSWTSSSQFVGTPGVNATFMYLWTSIVLDLIIWLSITVK